APLAAPFWGRSSAASLRQRATEYRSPRDGAAVERALRDGLRERRAARAAAVPEGQVRAVVHRGGRGDPGVAGIVVARPAAVRALVGPAWGHVAAACGRRRRRRRDRARRRRTELLARARPRARFGPRQRGVPPRRLEVRRLRERPQARERDGLVLDRRKRR